MNYDPLIELLEVEKKRIEKEIYDTEAVLSQKSTSRLKVRKQNGKWYYTVIDNGNEKYLSEKDCLTIRALCNEAYATHILPCLQLDFDIITKILNSYHPERRSLVYENMSGGRKKYITPLYRSVESIIAEFSNQKPEPYVYKNSVAPYQTNAGEMVRSKSEMWIANELFRLNIPYHYEEEFIIDGIVIHPDFTVMNPRTGKIYIWEHFGRMGDSKYSSDFVTRINRYITNGYIPGKNLLMTFESETCPLNVSTLSDIISNFLM